MNSDFTPMMKQYLSIKEECKDAILFFRLGDFYEMFFDDAAEATRILHITLTKREAGKGNDVPMCGVPYHAANSYIARLVKHGKKVAICDQVSEPVPGRSIVDRQITRIITPGTFMADELLDDSVNNYILSFSVQDGNFGIAYADLSTGEFRVTELNNKEDFFLELYKISPTECLMSEGFSRKEDFLQFKNINLGTITVNDDWMFDYELSLKEIKTHFRVESLQGFGCEKLVSGISAAGALLKYLKTTQRSSLRNIDVIAAYNTSQYMVMDRNTQRHMELIQNQEDMSSKGTLFGILNKTKTPMGKRMIKRWLLNPILDIDLVKERQDGVQYFCDMPNARDNVRNLLGEIFDIERLSNKVSMGTANARDIAALCFSLKAVGKLEECFLGTMPFIIKDCVFGFDDFKDVIDLIEACLVQNPPIALKEGGLIKRGYDAGLDELNDIIAEGKDWVTALQKREIERTGISSLKVGFNRFFGYYIEITRANLPAVPPDYVRKQTLVGAERFVTSELKEREIKIIKAEEHGKNLEYELFCTFREKIASYIERFKKAADRIASVDVLASLAEVAVKNRYCRPVVNNGTVLSIIDGRHPVLESILEDKQFVPNDIYMDVSSNVIFIITGSNMAGKSTYIRQVALIIIMAQMGSFIPAAKAEIGIIDRVFTRIGASDRLYQGMSTFMMEMVETAGILNNATKRSLIILDEIGRGTSTFDGVSIAWAVVEFIHHKLLGSKTLFATHYHELTELASMMKGVKNYHLAVQEWGDEIVFLYKVSEGKCNESFGIHVAQLAGMPLVIVKRAREILKNLHKDSFLGNVRSRFREAQKCGEKQLDLFENSYKLHPIIEKIKNIDIDHLTPIEALKKIADFKNELNDV